VELPVARQMLIIRIGADPVVSNLRTWESLTTNVSFEPFYTPQDMMGYSSTGMNGWWFEAALHGGVVGHGSYGSRDTLWDYFDIHATPERSIKHIESIEL
jgi:hypothetical protein